MAGELVRYKNNALIKSRIEEALARSSTRVALAHREPIESCPGCRHLGKPGKLPTVVDLARVCSVHDKPYAARYVLDGGIWRYGQTIRVTQTLWRIQYAGNKDIVVVPIADLGDEECPWCGATGRGPASCPNPGCQREVCYGLSTFDRFACRCGFTSGWGKFRREQQGIIPGQSNPFGR
jgi:hypothetical protein